MLLIQQNSAEVHTMSSMWFQSVCKNPLIQLNSRTFIYLQWGNVEEEIFKIVPHLYELQLHPIYSGEQYVGYERVLHELKNLDLSGLGSDLDQAAKLCAQNMHTFLESQQGIIWMRDHHMYEYYALWLFQFEINGSHCLNEFFLLIPVSWWKIAFFWKGAS